MPVTFQVVGNLADFGNDPRAGVKVRATATPSVKIGDTSVHSNEPETAVTDAAGAFTLTLVSLPGLWYRIQTPYANAINTVDLAGYVPDALDPTTGDPYPPGTVVDLVDVATEVPTPGFVLAQGPPGTTDYNALANRPTLGTAAATDAADYATATATPTLEEASTATVLLDTGTVSADRIVPLFSALYPVALDQASLAVSVAVPASDTDYWTVRLLRYRDGGMVPIATKTTKTVPSGGEAMTAFIGWTFDLAPFTFENLLAGDVLAIRFTPTGSPTALATPALTFRAPAADPVADPTVVVVSDTFTRADSATSLGTADTGQAWTLVGTNIFGISSGQVYSPNATENERAFVDAGVSDCTVEVKIAALAAGGSCGLFLRSAADGATGFNLSPVALFRYTAPSTNTLLASWTALVAGDTMRVKMSGSTLTVYRDSGSTGTFVQVAQVTDATNQTATRHGLRSTSNSGLANRMDNFKVTLP